MKIAIAVNCTVHVCPNNEHGFEINHLQSAPCNKIPCVVVEKKLSEIVLSLYLCCCCPLAWWN